MNYDVSVIIPNYNCQQYLAKCLSSVSIQQNVNVEIIVIDDGSSDNSLDWLLDIQSALPNLVVLQQPNSGVVAARNKAIAEAKGEYIAFLDADDYWTKDKLFEQICFMRSNPNVVLSFTNYMHVNENGKDIVDCFGYWSEFEQFHHDEHFYYEIKDPYPLIMHANVIGTSSVVVRRTAICSVAGFDRKLKSASDWDCWLKLANIGTFAYTYDISMAYLMRQNSITSNRWNRLEAMANIWKEAKGRVPVNMTTQTKIKARWFECVGEFHELKGHWLRAFFYGSLATLLFPHKRNVRRVMSYVSRAIKLRSYHEKNTAG